MERITTVESVILGGIALGAAAGGMIHWAETREKRAFAKVDSVQITPATGIAAQLQRASTHAKSPGDRLAWAEKASRAREWELPGR